MTSGQTPKLRLVRCPKCRQLLPESPDLPVYECGGCGTVLQAKIRKNNTRSVDSDLHKTEAPRINELDHISEYKECSSFLQEVILPPSSEISLEQNIAEEQNGSGGCDIEHPGGIGFCSEDQNRCSEQSKSEEHSIDGSVNIIEESLSSQLALQENKDPLPLAKANSDAENSPSNEEKSEIREDKRGSNFSGSSNTDLSGGGSSSNFDVHELVDESISRNTLQSPPIQELLQSHRRVLRGFASIRSRDTFATTEYADASSELSGAPRDMSKSPPTRSPRAYDGSISSYDGIDDRFSDHHHSMKSVYNVPNFGASEERFRRDNLLPKRTMNSNSEMQHQLWDSLSNSSDQKHYAIQGRSWYQKGFLEPTSHRHSLRNWRTPERKEFLSRMPMYQSGPQAGYENGSTSNQVYNDFQRIKSFHSPDRSKDPQHDKIELLRMVCELQDLLNMRCNINGRISTGGTWKEKHIPSYYKHEALEEELSHDSIYPRYSERCMEGGNWARQYKSSQIPSSGEASIGRHQVDQNCLHCFPQDWNRSVPLPRPVHCCNKGLCSGHAGQSLYNPYSSCTSSPWRYAESEFSMQAHKTKYDNQGHKNHVVKRHFRPTAGGAPFITCYCCLKLVQLPEDFLLFKRRRHRLRCGACSKILKFSLENGTQIVPYSSNAVDPPPSEVHDYSDVVGRKNPASTFHANDCSHVDPVSSSDDGYGHSFLKNCTTERYPVSPASLDSLQCNTDNRKMSYGSSSEPFTERKEFVKKLFRKKHKNPVETYGSTGNSSNLSRSEFFSSEIEEPSSRAGSQLHQLMGYSSPSEMINGSGLTASGEAHIFQEKISD